MAIVLTGNDLTAPVLQPGWTVVSDGFGLNTSTSVYKGDWTTDIDSFLVKGTAHPDPAYTYLKLDKWRVSWDAGEICTITVEYVGIDTAINGGLVTNPQISGANGLTSENLTAHPNFKDVDVNYTGGVIAGPPPYSQSPLGPLVEIKTNGGLVAVAVTGVGNAATNKQQSFIGQNGACFESQSGGRFIGFVDPAFPSLYGRTNYLATTTTYSGILYVKEEAQVLALLDQLNTASPDGDWNTFTLLPDWAPVGTAANVGHRNLLSQINVEEFGSLYKVNYEVRYQKYGWDASVYINNT